MLTKRLLRSSTLLLASIVAYAVYYFVHDLVYPPTHKHAVDTASKWSDEGKAIWLGVGAAEAPEPVVDTAEIPTEAEIEKMKIKELKAFLEARDLECKGCAEKSDYVVMAKASRKTPVVPESERKSKKAKEEVKVEREESGNEEPQGYKPQSEEEKRMVDEMMAKMRREKGGPGAGGPSFAGPGGAGGRPKPNLTPEKLARIADDPVAWRQFLMEQGVEQDKIPSVEEIKRARAEERAKREREGNGGRDEL